MEDWGESASELMVVKKNNYKKNCTQDSLAWVFLPFVHVVFSFVSGVLFLVLSCLLGNCCWLTVCIVVVDLCVLLSYVYLLYYVCIVFFYFKCQTAGYRSVLGRSCDRPSRHRFFLVSLCRKANAEMVPKIPSCHYMLLM